MLGAIALGALLVVGGCGSSAPEPVMDPMDDMPAVEEEVQTAPVVPDRDEGPVYEDPNMKYKQVLMPIRFEFNKYRITPEAKPALEGIASLLKDNPRWRVLVAGHCDERGTAEYNMSLGEQRALSTKRYLASLGVAESRFQTISYGEEKPVDRRSNEEAWAKNRRAEFRVEAPGS
ncbi:OmpA family protein [bacterium]|nr:OmpA family protein [bacterium]